MSFRTANYDLNEGTINCYPCVNYFRKGLITGDTNIYNVQTKS